MSVADGFLLLKEVGQWTWVTYEVYNLIDNMMLSLHQKINEHVEKTKMVKHEAKPFKFTAVFIQS